MIERWLSENGKAPYHLPYEDGGEAFWYWGTMADYDPDDPESEDDLDFLLPVEVFARLKAKTTYPNVKMYWTKQQALDDLAQALDVVSEENGSV